MNKLFVGIFLMIYSTVMAQNCDINFRGKIMDFHDGLALENAQISIPAINKTVTTQSNGNFSMDNICAGEYKIMVQHHDCEPLTQTIVLTQDKNVTWYLEHHTIELEKVETKGFQKRENATVAETHIHKEEIQSNSSETIGSVLKSITGVSGLETGNNIIKPIIHGMHSSRVIMLNNGIRQEDMEWGVEHAPNMDLNAFQDIRVIKGASALRYGGDAIGGIILTEYAHLPKKDTLRGHISATGIANGLGGNINGLIQKGFDSPLSLQVQGSYKKHGDFKTKDYYLTNSGSEQKAFSTEIAYGNFKQKLSLSYSFFDTDLGILRASHFGSLNDLIDAINAPQPFLQEDFSYTINKPYQHIQHHLAKLKAEKRFQGLGKLEGSYAFQFNKRQEFDIRNSDLRNIPSMEVELTTHSGELFLLLDKWQHLTIETGFNTMLQDNFSNPRTLTKRLIPDHTRITAGAFSSVTYKLGHSWILNGGLRYDFTHIDAKKYYYKDFWEEMNYNQDFSDNIIGDFGNDWLTNFKLNYHTFSTTLGAIFKPSNTTALGLNYAFANRPPNPAELFSEGLHHSAVAIELGDVRLNPENSHKISLNLNKEIDILNGLNINILGYYNEIKNYIYQVPTGAKRTIRGAFPEWSFKQINATITGFDFNANLQLTPHWSYETKLSYLYGQDKINKVALINMPPLDWNQKIKYQSVGQLSPYFALSSEYLAKQNRFPNYDFTINVLDNGEYVDKTAKISASPKSYFLINLEAGITLNKDKDPIKVSGKIKNMGNTSYRNYLNRFRYFADEMGRQIQLQITYNF